jgi:hypothetical protein
MVAVRASQNSSGFMGSLLSTWTATILRGTTCPLRLAATAR